MRISVGRQRVLDQRGELAAQRGDDERDLGDAERLGELGLGADVDPGEHEAAAVLVGQPVSVRLISTDAGTCSDQKLTITTTDIERCTTSLCRACSPTTSNE